MHDNKNVISLCKSKPRDENSPFMYVDFPLLIFLL